MTIAQHSALIDHLILIFIDMMARKGQLPFDAFATHQPTDHFASTRYNDSRGTLIEILSLFVLGILPKYSIFFTDFRTVFVFALERSVSMEVNFFNIAGNLAKSFLSIHLTIIGEGQV